MCRTMLAKPFEPEGLHREGMSVYCVRALDRLPARALEARMPRGVKNICSGRAMCNASGCLAVDAFAENMRVLLIVFVLCKLSVSAAPPDADFEEQRRALRPAWEAARKEAMSRPLNSKTDIAFTIAKSLVHPLRSTSPAFI